MKNFLKITFLTVLFSFSPTILFPGDDSDPYADLGNGLDSDSDASSDASSSSSTISSGDHSNPNEDEESKKKRKLLERAENFLDNVKGEEEQVNLNPPSQNFIPFLKEKIYAHEVDSQTENPPKKPSPNAIREVRMKKLRDNHGNVLYPEVVKVLEKKKLAEVICNEKEINFLDDVEEVIKDFFEFLPEQEKTTEEFELLKAILEKIKAFDNFDQNYDNFQANLLENYEEIETLRKKENKNLYRIALFMALEDQFRKNISTEFEREEEKMKNSFLDEERRIEKLDSAKEAIKELGINFSYDVNLDDEKAEKILEIKGDLDRYTQTNLQMLGETLDLSNETYRQRLKEALDLSTETDFQILKNQKLKNKMNSAKKEFKKLLKKEDLDPNLIFENAQKFFSCCRSESYEALVFFKGLGYFSEDQTIHTRNEKTLFIGAFYKREEAKKEILGIEELIKRVKATALSVGQASAPLAVRTHSSATVESPRTPQAYAPLAVRTHSSATVKSTITPQAYAQLRALLTNARTTFEIPRIPQAYGRLLAEPAPASATFEGPRIASACLAITPAVQTRATALSSAPTAVRTHSSATFESPRTPQACLALSSAPLAQEKIDRKKPKQAILVGLILTVVTGVTIFSWKKLKSLFSKNKRMKNSPEEKEGPGAKALA